MPGNVKKYFGMDATDTPKFVIWQVKLWDRFAKISPVLLVLVTITLYMLGFRNWELAFDTAIIMLGIVSIVWWFWILYTIALIAYVIDRSSTRLEDVLKDIKDVRDDIYNFDRPPDSQR
jgi:hypothetical protein